HLGIAGLGCVRADGPWPGDFWREDPHAKVAELVTRVDHARWGDYLRWGPVVKLHRTPAPLKGAALGGEHTDAILAELGYDESEVTRFHESGVVWSEVVEGAGQDD